MILLVKTGYRPYKRFRSLKSAANHILYYSSLRRLARSMGAYDDILATVDNDGCNCSNPYCQV